MPVDPFSILFGIAGLALQNKDKIQSPNLNKAIVESISKFEEKYPNFPSNLLVDFLSDENISLILNNFKKNKKLDYQEIKLKFLEFCGKKHDHCDEILDFYLSIFEKSINQNELTSEKTYDIVKDLDMKIDSVKDDTAQIKEDTNVIIKTVDSLKNLISHETKSLTFDGISPEINPNNKINLSKEKQLEHNHQLDQIINLIATYSIPSQNLPASIIELMKMSSYYHDTNQPEKSIIFIDKILERDPDNVYALTNKGIILHMQKKDDTALFYYDKSLDINPNFCPSLVNKAILLSDLGEYEIARRLCDKVINLEPKNIVALLAKGVLLDEKFHLPLDALQCYDDILSFDPFNFGSLHNKTGILKSLKRYDDALVCYEKILEKNPNDETALAFKGYMLSIKGDSEKSLEYYNKSLAIKPNDIPTLLNKATNLRDLKRYDESIVVLETALIIDPNYPHTLFIKASVLSFQGNNDDALKLLKQSIDLDSKYKLLAHTQMHEDLKQDPRFQKITN